MFVPLKRAYYWLDGKLNWFYLRDDLRKSGMAIMAYSVYDVVHNNHVISVSRFVAGFILWAVGLYKEEN
ncbi:MAG: hypothetical protein KGI54_13050 [Pseudomonadota bacterium]|nr:hypothetical protein [Pseudomonadota bacterium]